MSNLQKIEQLVKAQAGQQFKGSDFRELLGPGVYVLLSKSKPIYVGRGNNLLRRLSGLHHKRYVIDSCDELKLFPCISVQASVELEELLIGSFQPRFNDKQKTSMVAHRLGLARFRSNRNYKKTQ
jgi:hypothetical protein